MKQNRSKTLTLAAYVERRNGVPLGTSGSLENMLVRSLGAGTFAKFWQYWNPIWGYALGRYVYAPLNRLLPTVVAFVLTFTVSGVVHDLVTTLVRRGPAFLFTPWFTLMGLMVVMGRIWGIDYSAHPFAIRVIINFSLIAACLLLTFGLQHFI